MVAAKNMANGTETQSAGLQVEGEMQTKGSVLVSRTDKTNNMSTNAPGTEAKAESENEQKEMFDSSQVFQDDGETRKDSNTREEKTTNSEEQETAEVTMNDIPSFDTDNASSTPDSPSLGEDIDTMIDISQLIYNFCDVRQLVRSKPEKYEGADNFLQHEDIMGSEVLKFLEKNSDALRGEIGYKAMEQYDVMINLIGRLEKTKNVRSFLEQKTVDTMSTVKIEAFHDAVEDNSVFESDLVYGIGFNPKLKVITVAFRGTKTLRDWATNLSFSAKSYENPLKGREGQSDFLRFHKGFAAYLFYKKNDWELNKYEEIVKKVKSVCYENPGSKIYFTGHSLGGAEATIAAFHCAAEESQLITKPIRCITIGSPLVGDQAFRNAYMLLERDGLLQHMRISNEHDFVTAIPNISFLPLNTYKHVGVHFRLLGGGKYRVSYPKNGNSDPEEVRQNNLLFYFRPGSILNHLLYDQKVKSYITDFSKFSFEGLYQDKNLIGDYRNLQQNNVEKSLEVEDGEEDKKTGKKDLLTELWGEIHEVITTYPICSDMFHKY